MTITKKLTGTSLLTTAFVTIVVGTVLFVLLTILVGTSVAKVNLSIEAGTAPAAVTE